MINTLCGTNAEPCPATLDAGSLFIFGSYPQGTGNAPIPWRILQNEGDALLLLSERILDCRRYHHADSATSWRDCSLRSWLNEVFLLRAFDEAERHRILGTRCTDNGTDAPDTDDKVFLPSVAQVLSLTGRRERKEAPVERRALATAYARVPKEDGCRLYVYDKSKEEDYLEEDGARSGCSWWWLRTRGNRDGRACFVGTLGSIRTYAQVDLPYYGIRPAIRITLSDS